MTMQTFATAARAAMSPLQRSNAAWEADLLEAVNRATGASAGPVDIVALPQVVNLTIYRGMDFTLLVDVTSPEGDPADISGRIVVAQIRGTPESDTVAGEFQPTIADSTIVLYLAASVTELLPDSARWDVWLCDYPRTPLAAGLLTVEPRVTRCPEPE
jgi:hypothetical protein